MKQLGGLFTRNFRNNHHAKIEERDYGGDRAIISGNYKLVIDGEADSGVELFDLSKDPAEKHNLAESEPERVKKLQKDMRDWQRSVLKSLTGADYE